MDYWKGSKSEAQARFAAKRDKWFNAFIMVLQRTGATPNFISALGVVFAICAALIPPSLWYLAVLFLSLYIFMDGLDGPLARATGKQSKAGSLIDMFSDQIGVVIISVGAVFWLDAILPSAIVFSILYIHVIYMMVICDVASLRFPRIFRVKYFYFLLYLCCAYLGAVLPLDIFHIVFGLYYFAHFLILISIISKELK